MKWVVPDIHSVDALLYDWHELTKGHRMQRI